MKLVPLNRYDRRKGTKKPLQAIRGDNDELKIEVASYPNCSAVRGEHVPGFAKKIRRRLCSIETVEIGDASPVLLDTHQVPREIVRQEQSKSKRYPVNQLDQHSGLTWGNVNPLSRVWLMHPTRV